jgi:histidine phosphotransfer protein HptB
MMLDSHFFAVAATIRSTMADDSEMEDLLRAFAETIPQKRETLRAFHREGSLEKLRGWAHQLKGAGGGYGFPGLSEAAADLEVACGTQNANRITQSVDRLADYLSRIEV